MSQNEFIDKEEAEAKKAKEEKKSSRKKRRRKKEKGVNESNRILVQMMNGEFLSKENFIANLPFTFFIGFLLVFVIAWGYYAETVTKKEVNLEKELGELNSEYFSLGSEYNTKRGRRQVAEKLKGTGVKESTTSPKKIKVKKYRIK